MFKKLFSKYTNGFISGIAGLLAVCITIFLYRFKIKNASMLIPPFLGLIALITGKYSTSDDNTNKLSQLFGATGMLIGVAFLLLIIYFLIVASAFAGTE